MLQARKRHSCSDSSKKILLLWGNEESHLYAGYALSVRYSVQYPAWFRRNVGLVEYWFGFFFYHGRKLSFYPGCRSPPLEIWKLIHFQISEVKDERREKIQWF